jgi:hypothetical protein
MRVGAMNKEFDEAACGGRVEGYSRDRPAARAGLVASGSGGHVRCLLPSSADSRV